MLVKGLPPNQPRRNKFRNRLFVVDTPGDRDPIDRAFFSVKILPSPLWIRETAVYLYRQTTTTNNKRFAQ